MPKNSYIELLNDFHDLDSEYGFSDKECTLYYYLLRQCNRLRWKTSFGVVTSDVTSKYGWGRTSFNTARQNLVEAGLIEYTSGNGRGDSCKYIIKDIKKVSYSDNLFKQVNDNLFKQVNDNLSGANRATSLDKDKDSKTNKDKNIYNDNNNNAAAFSSDLKNLQVLEGDANAHSVEDIPPVAPAPLQISLKGFIAGLIGRTQCNQCHKLCELILQQKGLSYAAAVMKEWFNHFGRVFFDYVRRENIDADRSHDEWDGDFTRWITSFNTSKYVPPSLTSPVIGQPTAKENKTIPFTGNKQVVNIPVSLANKPDATVMQIVHEVNKELGYPSIESIVPVSKCGYILLGRKWDSERSFVDTVFENLNLRYDIEEDKHTFLRIVEHFNKKYDEGTIRYKSWQASFGKWAKNAELTHVNRTA